MLNLGNNSNTQTPIGGNKIPSFSELIINVPYVQHHDSSTNLTTPSYHSRSDSGMTIPSQMHTPNPSISNPPVPIAVTTPEYNHRYTYISKPVVKHQRTESFPALFKFPRSPEELTDKELQSNKSRAGSFATSKSPTSTFVSPKRTHKSGSIDSTELKEAYDNANSPMNDVIVFWNKLGNSSDENFDIASAVELLSPGTVEQQLQNWRKVQSALTKFEDYRSVSASKTEALSSPKKQKTKKKSQRAPAPSLLPAPQLHKKDHKPKKKFGSTGEILPIKVDSSALGRPGHKEAVDYGGLNQELSIRAEMKCLHCRSKETPEWRRGPLGSRTLCNACGLFYSKLIRRHGLKLADKIIAERKEAGRVLDRKIA